MKLETAISQLVTALSNLSWTSDDGSGTTSLQEVFNYQNYSHAEGYPFACVYEVSGVGQSLTNMDIEFDTEVVVDICVNWSTIETQTSDELKMKEANLRLREAWDYIKTEIFDHDFIANPDFTLNPSYLRTEMDEINLYIMRVTYNLKETINRE